MFVLHMPRLATVAEGGERATHLLLVEAGEVIEGPTLHFKDALAVADLPA